MCRLKRNILGSILCVLIVSLCVCGKENKSDDNASHPVLLVASQVYDDGMGNQAAIACDVYYLVDGKIKNIGQIESFGTAYPIAYDKTTRTAIPEKGTLALAFVMAMNYLAILLCPFIIDFFQSMFHVKSQQFAFIFNLCIALVATIWAYVKRDSFLFNDKI